MNEHEYIQNKSSISRDRRREERENVCPLKRWNIIGSLALTGTLGAMISQGCFVMKLPDTLPKIPNAPSHVTNTPS